MEALCQLSYSPVRDDRDYRAAVTDPNVIPATLVWQTDAVARTETAKEYSAGKRLYGNVEGDLLYAFDMAAVGEELQPHTWARLQRA